MRSSLGCCGLSKVFIPISLGAAVKRHNFGQPRTAHSLYTMMLILRLSGGSGGVL